MNKQYKFVLLNQSDNVVVALDTIPKGSVVPIEEINGKMNDINLKMEIAFGHKFAIRLIKKGEAIIKYGEVIGSAITDIESGEHVHVHNLEGVRGRGDQLDKY
ncbi:UxaA family hydrolase [Gracilibacillus sp. D59]|uniref:UxaA family hydrolase n=1 Tax=Gracilibacillus sp. D59 TaxID=3457434 RepID=UPI003FCEAA1F